MDTPILFLVFNRPEVTARVFEAVRRAQPKRLFVAADGPRPDKANEAKLCEQVRAIASNVDWPCETSTLYREDNLGCRLAVSSAITWFFENVERGIILEDDCLPDPSFFAYCEDLLNHYRNDTRVTCISGYNNFHTWDPQGASYSFSSLPLIWGWATWRRAWNYYNFDDFVAGDHRRLARSISEDPTFVRKLAGAYQATAAGDIDTWDYVWTYCMTAQAGLTCVPCCNLVSNIGFGSDATHTSDTSSEHANKASSRIETPLRHPHAVFRDPDFDAAYLTKQYGVPVIPTFAYKLARKWQRTTKSVGL